VVLYRDASSQVPHFLRGTQRFARDDPAAGAFVCRNKLRVVRKVCGVFDAFTDESGRKAHLNGPIAQALMAKAPELFSRPPAIEQIDVLGVKLPK
jgi:hypothetical protein